MGKRYDWEVTPQNTPRFKEKRILVLLANGLFVLNLLIIHCASGRNNVVITDSSGFMLVGRPLYYGE